MSSLSAQRDYKHGIPLGTQSQWGWHNVANPAIYQLSKVYNTIEQHSRKVPYTFTLKNGGRQEAVSNWFRGNPHWLHLGLIGFDLRKTDGSAVKQTDIWHIHQTLDL